MEHTKGKLGLTVNYVPYEYDYFWAWIEIDGKRKPIFSIPKTKDEEQEANAERLVKCWNAFEKDGLVDKLLAACGTALKGYQHICHCCGSTLPKPCSCKWEPLKTMLEQAIAGEK